MPRGRAKRIKEGNEFDPRCAGILREEGYQVDLAHMSKGPADLVAVKPGEVVYVQCCLRRPTEQRAGRKLSASVSERWGPLWDRVAVLSRPGFVVRGVIAQADGLHADILWLEMLGPAPGSGRPYPYRPWAPDLTQTADGAA
jgi:hypothetical protein